MFFVVLLKVSSSWQLAKGTAHLARVLFYINSGKKQLGLITLVKAVSFTFIPYNTSSASLKYNR
jgi:hypothetical protein